MEMSSSALSKIAYINVDNYAGNTYLVVICNYCSRVLARAEEHELPNIDWVKSVVTHWETGNEHKDDDELKEKLSKLVLP